jgi:DNA repair photolyase
VFPVFRSEARGILSAASGFIRDAGFTHSLSPARNCAFGCTYCYVPTMGIYGGLKPEDWRHWGGFTTFKSNAPELLARDLRPDQRIYCSPMVDPYQPPEESERLMPRILESAIQAPPTVFAIQTRGPLILRDLDLLRHLSERTQVRISFSLTTDREEIRRLYEPRCAPIEDRLDTMCRLRAAGLAVHATLAPLLPCDPERLLDMALQTTDREILCDPFHARATKPRGATTRETARRISAKYGFDSWHDPGWQREIVARLRERAARGGRPFAVGTEAFAWLARQ